jgi:hypothetical protein
VQAWVEAFNRADVGALAAFYTEDAVNQRGYWDKLWFLRLPGLTLPDRS